MFIYIIGCIISMIILTSIIGVSVNFNLDVDDYTLISLMSLLSWILVVFVLITLIIGTIFYFPITITLKILKRILGGK